MEKSFRMKALTPSGVIYEGDVVSVMVPGEVGYLEVLAGHAQLISTLKRGEIRIRPASGEAVKFKSSGSGFIRVSRDGAEIILDEAAIVQPV